VTTRSWSLGFPAALLLIAGVLIVDMARAGGPRYVAGTTYFNSGLKGTPVTWADGIVNYYTDRGDLGRALVNADADAFVADAFSRWTSIPTAGITATRAGQLAEDVTGAGLLASGGLPPDVLPTAINQPVAVVYDADGSITEALVGQGASDPSLCASNGVFGGIDSIGADAHFVHALIILNGNCAQTAGQLPDLKYHLVRMIGQILGLDWSQANLNVVTHVPPLTVADLTGFPVMHAVDSSGCPECYGASVDPAQPKADDQAALSRLYPVTAANQMNFSGKQISSSQTARIFGSVYFVGATGAAAQPMQGVNVIARWVDQQTGIVSSAASVASVSGFRFRGNAGNPVTGTDDASNRPYSDFGSDDPADEGFFDLGGLPVPAGITNAEFELRVEAVDPVWSNGIQPYGTLQVAPSSLANRVFVFVPLGGELHQDILMTGSAAYAPNWFGATSFSSPATVPSAGDWTGALGQYSETDYFTFPAQANRTASMSVTALDDHGQPALNKAQPVIAVWPSGVGAGLATSGPMNTVIPGETRLDFSISATDTYRVGVSDFRGDGRPDFRYRAHVFYADAVMPPRLSAQSSTILSIRGMGFRQGDMVSMGGTNLPMLAISANQILVSAPAVSDGSRDLTMIDPATGSTSLVTGALIYGAGPNDTLRLISGAGQQAPVGTTLPAPIVVQALAPDHATPVGGASVFFSSSPQASLAACQGGSSCTVLTDQAGHASTAVTALTNGAITITAKLAPASYNSPQQVLATVSGTESALDIGLTPQNVWIAQGTSVALPLTARILSNGAPLAGRVVDFQVLKGSAQLSAQSVITDVNGYAAAILQASSIGKGILVSACVQNQPFDTPCLNFSAAVVAPSSLALQVVSGATQFVRSTQNFSPVVVQVTDSASPAHPVLGATVKFQAMATRPPQSPPTIWIGDTGIGSNPMPVILSSSQAAVQSDENGLAAFQPPTANAQGSVIVLGTALTGSKILQFQLQSITPGQSAARSNLQEDSGAR
jgi:hypothetical protein